jgi:cytochrome c oxidase subunit 4
MQHDHDNTLHSVGYTIYILVWMGLVVLTGVTVVIAGVDLRQMAVLTALIVAVVKSVLVMSFFMHLKYEPATFKLMVLVLIITFAIFLILTFSDVLFRSSPNVLFG